jgi:hypothetical protein
MHYCTVKLMHHEIRDADGHAQTLALRALKALPHLPSLLLVKLRADELVALAAHK